MGSGHCVLKCAWILSDLLSDETVERNVVKKESHPQKFGSLERSARDFESRLQDTETVCQLGCQEGPAGSHVQKVSKACS